MAVALVCMAAGAAADAPQRVVSMNLCTDQLAMLIAEPEQILSLSALATDPMSSLMADQARAWPGNIGRAENIHLLRPDLVLAGEYSDRATVDMLTRLGVRVETVASANSIDDVRANIVLMGELLGRPARAAGVLARFDADLATLPRDSDGPLAVNYNANGYTTGSRTLQGDVLRRAGFSLLTDRIGFDYGGNLPLETLVMADPALIVEGSRYHQPSRSEEILDHPALSRLSAQHRMVPDRDWICGLPRVAQVAAELAGAR